LDECVSVESNEYKCPLVEVVEEVFDAGEDAFGAAEEYVVSVATYDVKDFSDALYDSNEEGSEADGTECECGGSEPGLCDGFGAAGVGLVG